MANRNANNHADNKTYGYPGTWYTGKDGKHHKCRTINGQPCSKHAGAGAHITDEQGKPIIASTEEELEAKLHAEKHIGLMSNASQSQHDDANIDSAADSNSKEDGNMNAFKDMAEYVNVSNANKPLNKPVVSVPKPGALMFKGSKMKTAIIMKQKKDEARSKRLASGNQPYLTHDDIMKSINENKDALEQNGLWIYDNPVYKGTTRLSVGELAHEIIRNGDYGNDLHDSSDAYYENMIDESSYSTWSRITHADRFSVIDYTEVGYYNANKLLNADRELDDRSAMLVNGVDKAMRVSKPLPHDTVFYRYAGDDDLSMSIRNAEEAMYYHSVGSDAGVVPRKSFISTTMKPGSFLKDYGNHATTEFIMIARKGVRGFSMSNRSNYDEHEFLINRGYDTRVLGIYETGGVDSHGSWLNHHPVLIIEILPSKTAQNGSKND